MANVKTISTTLPMELHRKAQNNAIRWSAALEIGVKNLLDQRENGGVNDKERIARLSELLEAQTRKNQDLERKISRIRIDAHTLKIKKEEEVNNDNDKRT